MVLDFLKVNLEFISRAKAFVQLRLNDMRRRNPLYKYCNNVHSAHTSTSAFFRCPASEGVRNTHIIRVVSQMFTWKSNYAYVLAGANILRNETLSYTTTALRLVCHRHTL